jgi:hypothetical protein
MKKYFLSLAFIDCCFKKLMLLKKVVADTTAVVMDTVAVDTRQL